MNEAIHLSVREAQSDDPDVVRVEIVGELDFSNAPALRRSLRALERRRPRVLVLDLSGLQFMDVAGVRTMLDAARRAGRDGRRVVVANPIPVIAHLLELTVIDRSLDVVEGPFAAA